MNNYYAKSLNSDKLKRCYDIAPERIKQYLEAEISFVASKCKSNNVLLDLGCGYGRVTFRLEERVKRIVGIDNSEDNIKLANKLRRKKSKCKFIKMNAIDLKFEDNLFDIVICVQNGISAIKVDPQKLIKESIRVTKRDGILLFSSYSNKIWNDRLEWFKIQSEEGLIGEIDYELSKDGNIVCKDGLELTTFSKDDFLKLSANFNIKAFIHEVDNSSIFCEMIVR